MKKNLIIIIAVFIALVTLQSCDVTKEIKYIVVQRTLTGQIQEIAVSDRFHELINVNDTVVIEFTRRGSRLFGKFNGNLPLLKPGEILYYKSIVLSKD